MPLSGFKDARIVQPTDIDALQHTDQKRLPNNKVEEDALYGYDNSRLFRNEHVFLYCDVLKPKNDDHIKLVFTDTNICVLKIVIDDVYEDLKDLSEYMDIQVMAGQIRQVSQVQSRYKVQNDEKERKKSKGVMNQKVNRHLNCKKVRRSAQQRTE